MSSSSTDPLYTLMQQVAAGQIDPQRAAATLQVIIEQVALQVAASTSTEKSSCSCSGEDSSKLNQHGSITRTQEKDCHCGCGGSCSGKEDYPRTADGKIDFIKMTQAEKLKYNQAKRDQIYGKL